MFGDGLGARSINPLDDQIAVLRCIAERLRDTEGKLEKSISVVVTVNHWINLQRNSQAKKGNNDKSLESNVVTFKVRIPSVSNEVSLEFSNPHAVFIRTILNESVRESSPNTFEIAIIFGIHEHIHIIVPARKHARTRRPHLYRMKLLQAFNLLRQHPVGGMPQHGHGLPTKPVGKGTGLGLSIIRKSVDLLKGTITVNSTPGKGTEFHVTLPIHA